MKLISVDIEETLAETIETLPLSRDRGRLLKVLFSWTAENGNQVIVEKLAKILKKKAAEGADVSYAALLGAFAVTNKIHKWAKLKNFMPEHTVAIGATERVSLDLEKWAIEVNFLLQKGGIKVDSKYTMSRPQIAMMHRQYRNRLIYGAQYRADVVTLAELGVTTPKEIVKLIGMSREPATRILADLKDAGFIKESRTRSELMRGYLDVGAKRKHMTGVGEK